MVVLYNWPIYFHYYIFFTETMIESKRRERKKEEKYLKEENGWFLFSGLSRDLWDVFCKNYEVWTSGALMMSVIKAFYVFVFTRLNLALMLFDTWKDKRFMKRTERERSFIPAQPPTTECWRYRFTPLKSRTQEKKTTTTILRRPQTVSQIITENRRALETK